MSGARSATSSVAAPPSAFVDRCAILGVPWWVCNETGEIVLGSDAASVAATSLGTDDLHATIKDAVLRAAAATGYGDGFRYEDVPGCVVLVLPNSAVDAEPGWTVVVLCCEGDAPERATAGAPFAQSHPFQSASPCFAPAELDRMARLLSWMHADLASREQDMTTLNQFSERLVQAYEEINMLFRIARMLNCTADSRQLMEMVCHQLQQTLPFGWVAVRFDQRAKSIPGLADQLLVSGELPIEAATFDREARNLLERWSNDDWTRLLHPSSNSLARLVDSEVVADPITHDHSVIGALMAGNKCDEDSDLSSCETQFIDAMAEFLGVFHENLARFAEQRQLFLGTVRALTAAIDAKDPYTCGHSERVALLAATVAEALDMDREMVERYRIAGLVHDVGKIGIPEAVLCKPARLNEPEFAIIRRHPKIGHDILKDIAMLEPMLPGVLHHHERWDGGGYPSGLKGEEIPQIARVLAMADAFDAMSSNRAYRPALTREQVFEEIRCCSGSQFDPTIASMFVTLDFTAFDQLLQRHHAQALRAA